MHLVKQEHYTSRRWERFYFSGKFKPSLENERVRCAKKNYKFVENVKL